ncbi:MAG: TonB-dependent receptor [Pseudomonadota bacterium]|nr:TonB-dependent receptor [Pseudomonadota bacterium]
MKLVWLSSAALAVTVLPAALTPAALAQDNAGDREVITVKATKTELDSFVYPGLTSSIDVEDLDLAQPADLDDLLRAVPGVDIPGGPRRTGQTISLRGQGRDNTTLLMDGARQNFASAHDGAIFVDPSLLVGVETVRGPASALYGSGASGGVVAFRTASAHDLLGDGESWGYELGAGYRSVDEEERSTATLYAVQGAFDLLASLSSRQSGDISLGSGADLPADDRSLSGLVKLGADISDGVRAELSWQSFDGDTTEPNNGQGVAGVGAFNALVDKNIRSDNTTLSFDIAPASNSWLDMNVSIYRNETGVTEAETASTRILRRDLETIGISTDQRFAFDLGRYESVLTLGGEYYEDRQNGEDSAEPGGVRGGAPNADASFTAVYAQLELQGPAPFGLPGEVVLLPGIRNDSFETSAIASPATRNEATSARFGVTYAPISDFNMFVNWGEAFRAPSINELYIDGTHFSLPHIILGPPTFISNTFTANPDLLPEATETLEIGFGLDLAGRLGVDQLTIRTSWFETDAENLIDLFVDFQFDPTCFAPPFFAPCSAGTTQSRNVGSAELSGYEGQINFANGPLSIDASFSSVDGADALTGEALGSLTPDRVFVDARYALPAQRLVLGGRVQIAGDYDRPTNVAEHRDGYAVIDLYGRWRPLSDHGLTLNAGIENVFDADFERVFAGVSEPGRSVRLDVSWRRNF